MNTLTTLSIIFNGLFLGYLLYSLIKFIVDKTENRKREKEKLQDKLEFLERQYRYINDSIDSINKSLIRDAKNSDALRMRVIALEKEVFSMDEMGRILK